MIMRIAIVSDVHLGYGSGGELSEDPFEMFGEALEKSLGCDLILVAGDLFDSRSPSTEVLTRTMELLIRPMISENGAKLVSGIRKEVKELTPLHQQGIPVVAIHGTHERRVKGLMNPVQALEKAGFLIHLHAGGVVLEKDGEKVCVQGLSGVPDQFSGAALERWGPSPRKGCFNVLMLHQSVSPFMYAEHLLPVEKLPGGFDLYVLGHIHESRKASHSGAALLIPGSLVPTQLTKDSVSPRGFWILDTGTRDAAFIPLEGQRRVYLLENSSGQEALEKDIARLLEHRHQKKPIIRIKGGEPDMRALHSRFGDSAVLSFRGDSREKLPEPVGIEEHTLSVKELGRKLLRENLSSEGLETEAFEGVFELLVNGRQDEALRLLSPESQHKPGE
jgi:DNA repair exonuclease SbcCD nuclease subunit